MALILPPARHEVHRLAGGKSPSSASFMKTGDEVVLEITDVAYGGAGLARHGGRVVFVPFTVPGETVRARIGKVTRGWLQARALDILVASPDRIAPPCPWFGRCGGCAYQHIAYPRQLEIKARQVSEALRRIGKFPAPPVEPARPSPRQYGYRNRITVHVSPPRIGFHGVDARELIDVPECLLAADRVNTALQALRSKKRLRPGPATLRSHREHGGFRQVNDEAAEVLAAVVADMAGRGDTLLDAYCGAGFFAKRLRAQFARIVGIDWDGRSTECARRAAQASELYLTGDAADLLPAALAEHRPSVVLLDPPSQGAAPAVIDALLERVVPRLVYVSCDPSTLSRDASRLAVRYTLGRVVPVDMFPQTASIETAAMFEA
jgi:23S rRNA (uracil1939-C5)-methyltransferase